MAYLAVRGAERLTGEPLTREGEPTDFYASLSALAGGGSAIGHVTNGVHMPSWTQQNLTICGLKPAEKADGWDG